MRELKFRAWEQIGKRMSFSKMEQFDDMLGFRFIHFELGEPIYMQYTGLKDNNGVEIYEGDIITINKLSFESNLLPENLLVKFYGGMFQLYRGNENLMGLHLMYIEDGEVIGNIWENPELLQQSEGQQIDRNSLTNWGPLGRIGLG